MDFGTVLHKAQRNESGKKDVRYYSTKFEPPKKMVRTKTISVNVQKFLERKEAEEKKKQLEATKKRDDLLALRSQDKKASRRVSTMLKRTKSANKSVLEEANDKNNTAVTFAGMAQPDEDDYGYVSQESTELYNKLMERYSKMPDEPKFSLNQRKVSTNLTSTKDRVKAALEKAKEEEMMPKSRKRKHKESVDDVEEPKKEEVEDFKEKEPEKKKPKVKFAAPPPLNFSELLKIAEKKQFEPIVIEKKEKEEEKLLTKKQKLEQQREEERLKRRKEAELGGTKPVANKIPKLNGSSSSSFKIPSVDSAKRSESDLKKVDGDAKLFKKPLPEKKPIVNGSSSSSKVVESNKMAKPQNGPSRSDSGGSKPPNGLLRSQLESPKTSNGISKSQNGLSRPQSGSSKPQDSSKLQNGISKSSNGISKPQNGIAKPQNGFTKPSNNAVTSKNIPSSSLSARPDQKSRDLQKPKEFPPKDLLPRKLPPKDSRPKQFPPADVRRRDFPPSNLKRKPMVQKRRIYDDDEDEYDSELDDFIDDGPEGGEDYSKYISEIFGYDKSRYRDEEFDDRQMESTFAQQMREECISAKIGIMEDLEDMRMEEEEKKRKMKIKKQRR